MQDLETREGDGDDGRSQDDSLITCYRCCKAVFAPSTILVVHRYRAGYSHDFRAFPLSVNSCRNYTRIVSKTLIEFRVIVEEEGRVLFDVPLSLSLLFLPSRDTWGEMQRSHGFFRRETWGMVGRGEEAVNFLRRVIRLRAVTSGMSSYYAM